LLRQLFVAYFSGSLKLPDFTNKKIDVKQKVYANDLSC